MLCGFTVVICRPFSICCRNAASSIPHSFKCASFLMVSSFCHPAGRVLILTSWAFRGSVKSSIKSTHLPEPNPRGLLVPVLLLQDGPPWTQSHRVSRFHHSLCLPRSNHPSCTYRSCNSVGHLWLPLSFCSRRKADEPSPPSIRPPFW